MRTPACGRFRRFLRRTVLVAAFTGAGWLLSVIFAGGASAAPFPEVDDAVGFGSAFPEQPDLTKAMSFATANEHLDQLDTQLGSLLTGITNTISTVTEPATDAFEATATELSAVLAPSTADPIATLPEPIQPPAATTPPEPPPAEPPAAREPKTPAAPRAPPATTPVAEHTPTPFAPTRHTSSPAGDTGATAVKHANESPRPGKAPAPSPGGGPTATTVHDNTTGARGMQGAPATPAAFEPPPAGFANLGHTPGAHGRIAGLPATSPD